jgi:putative transposase
LPRSSSVKRSLIDAEDLELSIRRQCELLELERSTYYYEPAMETAENLKLMRSIDELYLAHPFLGSRRMSQELGVNRKRAQRLMRLMGLEAIYPTTRRHPGRKIYPYLLRDLEICRSDQVWSTDITYIPLARGYLYLTAVLDWHSRYVLAWRLSTSLEGSFCCEALEQALSISQPEIFNTDQGVQFTSMDGQGRALDNVFIERLWRSVKYEEVYLQEYQSADDARASLKRYWRFYNQARKHQSLEYRTPAEVYFGVKDNRSRSWDRTKTRAR